MYLKFGYLF